MSTGAPGGFAMRILSTETSKTGAGWGPCYYGATLSQMIRINGDGADPSQILGTRASNWQQMQADPDSALAIFLLAAMNGFFLIDQERATPFHAWLITGADCTRMCGRYYNMTPKDGIMYVSTVPDGELDGNILPYLRENIIAQGTADGTGVWEVRDIPTGHERYLLWCYGHVDTADLTFHIGGASNQYISFVGYHTVVPPEGTLHTMAYTVTNEKPEMNYITLLPKGTGAATIYVSHQPESMELADLAVSVVACGPLDSYLPTLDSGEYVIWYVGDEITDLAVTTSTSATIYPCLSGDTRITMADGSTKALRDVVVGDMLLTSTGPSRVKKTSRGKFKPYHTKYYFSDGTVVDESFDHRFYNLEQGFWQLLRLWNIGEHAVRHDGSVTALVRWERIEESAELFGVWTESLDYYAEGLLTGETAANCMVGPEADPALVLDILDSFGTEGILYLFGLEGIYP